MEQGNAYLEADFPLMDYTHTARIMQPRQQRIVTGVSSIRDLYALQVWRHGYMVNLCVRVCVRVFVCVAFVYVALCHVVLCVCVCVHCLCLCVCACVCVFAQKRALTRA